MNPGALTAFGVWLIAVAAFMLVSGAQLPQTVAARFGPDGAAIAFMPRAAFLAVMTGCGVGLPALLVLLPAWIGWRWPHRLSVPNRDYWLAPQRLEASRRALIVRLMVLGGIFTLLLGFVHHEVVQANLRTPPALDGRRFTTAVVLFVIAFGAWIAGFYRRFGRRAQ